MFDSTSVSNISYCTFTHHTVENTLLLTLWLLSCSKFYHSYGVVYPPWFSWKWLLCSKFDHSYGVVYPPMVGHHGFLDKEYNVPSMTILITDSTPHHGVVCPVWLTMVNYWWTNVSISPPPMSRTIGKKMRKILSKMLRKTISKEFGASPAEM